MIPVPDEPFSLIHVDLVGPMPPFYGYTHLLTIINRSSQLPEAMPMSKTTADACADALLFHWVSRFGVPPHITSDQGSQFTSALWNWLASTLGADLHWTSSYHPQSNQVVKLLLHSLKVSLHAEPASWLPFLGRSDSVGHYSASALLSARISDVLRQTWSSAIHLFRPESCSGSLLPAFPPPPRLLIALQPHAHLRCLFPWTLHPSSRSA